LFVEILLPILLFARDSFTGDRRDIASLRRLWRQRLRGFRSAVADSGPAAGRDTFIAIRQFVVQFEHNIRHWFGHHIQQLAGSAGGGDECCRPDASGLAMVHGET
jgi:hypothetical protein